MNVSELSQGNISARHSALLQASLGCYNNSCCYICHCCGSRLVGIATYITSADNCQSFPPLSLLDFTFCHLSLSSTAFLALLIRTCSAHTEYNSQLYNTCSQISNTDFYFQYSKYFFVSCFSVLLMRAKQQWSILWLIKAHAFLSTVYRSHKQYRARITVKSKLHFLLNIRMDSSSSTISKGIGT